MSSLEEAQQRDLHSHRPRAQQLQCQRVVTRLTWKGRKSGWKAHEALKQSLPGGLDQGTITIMSLNRWFEGDPATAPQERLKALLSELAALSADVVNLQEVTQSAIRTFQDDDQFRKKWIVSSFDPGIYAKEGHGLLTLINKHTTDIVNSSRYPLDEYPDEYLRSNRTLLVSEVVKNGVHVCIINAHLNTARLEFTTASAYQEARARQVACRNYQISVASTIAQTFKASDGSKRVIFAGDMNLAYAEEELALHFRDFEDAWEMLYGSGGISGYTFGITPWSFKTNVPRGRPDRIAFMGKLRPVRSEILFTDPLPLAPDMRELLGHDVYLSDHAGVLAEFELHIPGTKNGRV